MSGESSRVSVPPAVLIPSPDAELAITFKRADHHILLVELVVNLPWYVAFDPDHLASGPQMALSETRRLQSLTQDDRFPAVKVEPLQENVRAFVLLRVGKCSFGKSTL